MTYCEKVEAKSIKYYRFMYITEPASAVAKFGLFTAF